MREENKFTVSYERGLKKKLCISLKSPYIVQVSQEDDERFISLLNS